MPLPEQAHAFLGRAVLFLWREGAARLSAADDLAVIGYSMPRYDTWPRFLVSR